MRLTRGLGRQAASALVVLYALCLLAPPAALAFGDASHAAHCISHDHHGLAPVHAHQDGAAQPHSGDDGDGKGEPGQCCGLVCLTALPVTPPLAATEPAAPTLISIRHDGLSSHTPDRLYRPPISLLSL
jgi:hypothetical protein